MINNYTGKKLNSLIENFKTSPMTIMWFIFTIIINNIPNNTLCMINEFTDLYLCMDIIFQDIDKMFICFHTMYIWN